MPELEVDFELQPLPAIEADFEIQLVNNDHNVLINRDISDQHPIGAITGLQTTLDSKVDKTSESSKVYGTDSSGQQTTYNLNQFGGVGDVLVDGESVVTDNVANLGSMALENSSDYSTTTQADNLYASKSYEGIIDNHISDKNNPHEVTKNQVGLGNVDNTSDLNKPISTATQTALDGKVGKVSTANKVYGTDANGTQTTYDVGSFGQVDDVQVGGISVVTNKIAELGTMAGETASNYYTSVQVDTALSAKQDNLSAGNGIDITSNTVSVTDPTLVNNGTGTKALAVGKTSQSTAEGGVAVGYGAQANSTYGTAIGYDSRASNTNTTVIGKGAKATQARAIAIGSGAEANAQDAIAIKGINNTANTFQVYTYNMLDMSTGLIPDARISTNIARSSDIPTVDQTYSGSSTNAQSGVAVASAISTETSNRESADNNLQSQIDAIVSSSDVFDIVGTYAELQAYDITTVPVNDIIKVLVDSTHGGAATYYRCVESGGVKSWSYIGSEGAYYTKGEADSLFVPQTRTVNNMALSSNITLTASDVGADASGSANIAETNAKNYADSLSVNYATAAQGTLADSALQSGDNVSELANDAGYLTGITSSDVTTALGYTPYDNSNPAGYITSSALTPYVLSSSLATVATSGDYGDLSNKPTIPTVNNPTITFTQGGVTKGTITLNQSSNETIALDAGGGGGGAVDSVNGYTGVVVLTASDVGALATSDVVEYTAAEVETLWGSI